MLLSVYEEKGRQAEDTSRSQANQEVPVSSILSNPEKNSKTGSLQALEGVVHQLNERKVILAQQ